MTKSGFTTSPNLDPGGIERGKQNDTIMNSGTFKSACEKAGIPETRRQASKFRRKTGLAYRNK